MWVFLGEYFIIALVLYAIFFFSAYIFFKTYGLTILAIIFSIIIIFSIVSWLCNLLATENNPGKVKKSRLVIFILLFAETIFYVLQAKYFNTKIIEELEYDVFLISLLSNFFLSLIFLIDFLVNLLPSKIAANIKFILFLVVMYLITIELLPILYYDVKEDNFGVFSHLIYSHHEKVNKMFTPIINWFNTTFRVWIGYK